jgi:hypothetical protein
MTAITLVKDLPTSDYYSGSGTTTISLQAIEFIMNTKKTLQKIVNKKNKSRQNSSPTDQPVNKVVDLQSVEETIVIRAWLDDDETESAWNKAWKLRAMCTRGGPLTSLTIGTATPLVFGSGDVTGVFLEENTFSFKSDDTGDITASHSAKPARIEVSFGFYLGEER